MRKLAAFKIIDRGARILAALTAVAAAPLVLMIGVMANDAGTPAGARTGLVVLLSGGAIIGWVILCCVIPTMISGFFGHILVLRIVLVDLPRYAFAIAGLSWCAMRVYMQLTRPSVPRAQARLSRVIFPQINRYPAQPIQLTGTLPSSIPIVAVVATYASDSTTGGQLSNLCSLRNGSGSARTRVDVIPLTISADRYEVTVYRDRYLPGDCHWHLTRIDYPLHFGDAGPSRRWAGTIEVWDEPPGASDVKTSRNLDQGPGQIWCGKGPMAPRGPYYPVVCNDYATFLSRVPSDAGSRIPSQLTESHNPIMALPGVRSAEFDFYDIDAIIAPVSPVSSARAH